MNVWPWSQLALLRRDLHAARGSCSANAKRCNRLSARIIILDQACKKHRAQERHDQAYIDALEELVSPAVLAAARAVVVDLGSRASATSSSAALPEGVSRG